MKKGRVSSPENVLIHFNEGQNMFFAKAKGQRLNVPRLLYMTVTEKFDFERSHRYKLSDDHRPQCGKNSIFKKFY